MNKVKTFTDKHTDTDINKFTEKYPNGELVRMYEKMKYIYSDEFVERPIASFMGNAKLYIYIQKKYKYGDKDNSDHSLDFKLHRFHIFEKMIVLCGTVDCEFGYIFLDESNTVYTKSDLTEPFDDEEYLYSGMNPLLLKSDWEYSEYSYRADREAAEQKYYDIDKTKQIDFNSSHPAFGRKPAYSFGYDDMFILADILKLKKYDADVVYEKTSKKIITDYSLNRK